MTPVPGATPWTAEIDVSPAAARDLIASQFPSLAGATIEPYAFGWDNTAYLVDGEFIFRFPRRSVAAPLIAREIEILPLLAPHLSASIPVPIFAGNPSETYPWRFAGYRRLTGTTLCEDGHRDPLLASRLGVFLRGLHAIDPAAAIEHGLPDDEIGRLDHAKRLPQASGRLRELHAAGHIADPAPLIEMLQRIAPRGDEATRCVVHGDLYVRHVLIDRSGRLAGVIDWGDLHYGDPALDLAIVDLAFAPEDHAGFFATYGRVDERTRLRARYRAIHHAALTAQYGFHIGDAQLASVSVRALNRLRVTSE